MPSNNQYLDVAVPAGDGDGAPTDVSGLEAVKTILVSSDAGGADFQGRIDILAGIDGELVNLLTNITTPGVLECPKATVESLVVRRSGFAGAPNPIVKVGGAAAQLSPFVQGRSIIYWDNDPSLAGANVVNTVEELAEIAEATTDDLFVALRSSNDSLPSPEVVGPIDVNLYNVILTAAKAESAPDDIVRLSILGDNANPVFMRGLRRLHTLYLGSQLQLRVESTQDDAIFGDVPEFGAISLGFGAGTSDQGRLSLRHQNGGTSPLWHLPEGFPIEYVLQLHGWGQLGRGGPFGDDAGTPWITMVDEALLSIWFSGGGIDDNSIGSEGPDAAIETRMLRSPFANGENFQAATQTFFQGDVFRASVRPSARIGIEAELTEEVDEGDYNKQYRVSGPTVVTLPEAELHDSIIMEIEAVNVACVDTAPETFDFSGAPEDLDIDMGDGSGTQTVTFVPSFTCLSSKVNSYTTLSSDRP